MAQGYANAKLLVMIYFLLQVPMGPVQRFTVHDEKKEFALKTDHDREDLIELPHFINFPCDQGEPGSQGQRLFNSGRALALCLGAGKFYCCRKFGFFLYRSW